MQTLVFHGKHNLITVRKFTMKGYNRANVFLLIVQEISALITESLCFPVRFVTQLTYCLTFCFMSLDSISFLHTFLVVNNSSMMFLSKRVKLVLLKLWFCFCVVISLSGM
jgi:hypothetical protein